MLVESLLCIKEKMKKETTVKDAVFSMSYMLGMGVFRVMGVCRLNLFPSMIKVGDNGILCGCRHSVFVWPSDPNTFCLLLIQ